MIKSVFNIVILIFAISTSNAELLFKPLTANTFEPRVGALFQFGEKKLRLDIGTSLDLMNVYQQYKDKINIGTDFFTFTRLRSEGNFKFPVETSDYFFGINGSYKTEISKLPFSVRFRLAHISSHLVDGLAIDSIFKRRTFVYSREFVDLLAAVNVSDFRLYVGSQYVFSTKPKTPNPINPQLGFDYNEPINKWLRIIAGYDFKLVGINGVYSGVNTAQLGMMLQTEENIGILINLNAFQGKSIHGMFFMEEDSYIGLGFQLYFY